MTTLRTAAQQALEALYEETAWFGPTPKGAAAIAALKAALAQQDEPVQEPVQEPVAWYSVDAPLNYMTRCADGTVFTNTVAMPAHAVAWSCVAPPQRKPLTIERLRDALVASRIIPPAAVEDPDEYDDGVTLHRIEALHRRLT